MNGKKVVVIDDCRLTLSIARDILEGGGHTVMVAESALAANTMVYSSDPPDLILVDVEMPLLKGDRIIELLKKHKNSRNIPVLMISSHPQETLSGIAAEAGADDYLCKPLSRENLLPKVDKLFCHKE